MAQQDDDFHFQLRESPLHSREQSTASDWRTHNRNVSSVSNFSRPSTRDSSHPWKVPEFADSRKQLMPPATSEDQPGHPLRETFLSSETSLSSRPVSTGYHPGFPGPYAPVLNDSQTWLQSSSTTITEKPELQASPPAPVPPPGGPPPDGGLTAWLQVLGGYFLFFNTWGLINAFGVFQTYYKSHLIASKSNSQIAWIGTLTSFLLCASPITWGPIFDISKSPRQLVYVGSLAVVLGIMLTSLCTAYWHLMLAQGVVCGLGGGALFITATSVLPAYFRQNRALALGISASGSSLGGIIYPIIFRYAQPALGFPWAVRIIGFLALLTLLIPCLVIRPPPKGPNPTRRKLFQKQLLLDPPFALFNAATFFGFVGQYIPYFFIEQFASSHSIPTRYQFWMLIFLNLGSIPGRILPSLLATHPRFPPLTVLFTTTLFASILALSWLSIRTPASTPGLTIWCILYGFFSGAFVSLQGAAVASMTPDLRTIGTKFGLNMFAGALGILIGSPVGGAIFPVSWGGAQGFCAGSLLLAAGCVGGTAVVVRRGRGREG